jgi:predicted ATPase/DNA-binding winged helix-turn-helix (wHTH) protein
MRSPGEIVEFGPFRLFPFERRLVRNGEPIALGGRAFDLLIMLLDRSGEIVSNRDLIAHAWSGISVEDSSLRANIAMLRRVLGDNDDSARYIINVARRGYSFVSQVKRTRTEPRSSHGEMMRAPSRRISRIVGREKEMETILALVTTKRLLTIHGAGGVGKTTVARAVAESLSGSFEDGVCILDFSLLERGGSVTKALTAALGLLDNSADPMPGIAGALREREMLLVFDCCEHVVESAAKAAEALLTQAPRVRVLTTSREPLRSDGEQVFLLQPLEAPPEDSNLSMAAVLEYPAALLFHDRVVSSGHPGGSTDADARAIAKICRKVDGIALALEFAAGSVSTHGLVETASLLDGHLKLLWRGLRTAPARHQTLNAMLDWSYELLAPLEGAILYRLSVFVGRFVLSDALAIASCDEVDHSAVTDGMARLVEHCLIDVVTDQAKTYYRLLDTTRSYARTKLKLSGEEALIARRHAVHCRDSLIANAGGVKSAGPWVEAVANTRSALLWSFSPGGDAHLGMQIVVASAPHLIDRGLIGESFEWAERALGAMGPGDLGTRIEMELNSALATSSNFTNGNSARTQVAIERGLALAEALGDVSHQFQLLSGQSLYFLRLGNIEATCRTAQRAFDIAASLDEPAAAASAEVILGVAHYMAGNQEGALRHCGRGVAVSTMVDPQRLIFFGYDHRLRGLVTLALSQWQSGLPDKAIATARQSIFEAQAEGRPIDIAHALTHANKVFLWTGDLDTAARTSELATAHAAKHSLRLYETRSRLMQGRVMVDRGNVAAGIQVIRSAYEMIDPQQHQMDAALALSWIADALVRGNRAEEASIVFEDADRLLTGGSWPPYTCEIMRVKATVAAGLTKPNIPAAEDLLLRAVALARQQSAKAWELRCSTTLARLWAKMRRIDEAYELLSHSYRKFDEGFGTSDLRSARSLLDELEHGASIEATGRF